MRLILIDDGYAIMKDGFCLWSGQWCDRPDYISDDLLSIVEKEGEIDLDPSGVDVYLLEGIYSVASDSDIIGYLEFYGYTYQFVILDSGLILVALDIADVDEMMEDRYQILDYDFMSTLNLVPQNIGGLL
tara:strand:- start:331 stop:720 length:390 start_codon:yes stop_codon:yes gene_type:complete